MKSKKGLAGAILGITIILLSIFLIMESNKSKEDINIEKTKAKTEEELVLHIGKALQEEHQAFGIEYDIISDDEIILEVKLTEKITDNTINNIVSTAKEVISEHNYNPESFEFNVSSFES